MATKKQLTEQQRELESPVKGYQLKELTVEIADMKNDFGNKLNTIIDETKGTVTRHELDLRLKEERKEISRETDAKIRAVHLTYDPIKRGAIWAACIIVTTLVGIIAIQIKGG